MQGVDVHAVRSMLDLYDVGGQRWTEIIELTREARKKGWWHVYGVDDRGYVALEDAACSVWDYQVLTVPGLLQTEDYARALFRGGRQITREAEIDRHVAVRMGRQGRLTAEEPVKLWAIVDESALLRPVGGAEVMRAQLCRLVEVAELPNVTLQVLPMAVGANAGMEGAFIILDFADPCNPDIVFTEHRAGAVHLQKPADVRACRLAFKHLWSEALDPGESIAFIQGVMTQVWS
jgi:hypothetical protein